ncbi:MAG: hypothetical protein AB8G22_16355 [Saprospiraceae bacterium]
MKNTFILFALFTLFCSTAFAQDNLTAEKTAIKKVIEDETKHFMAQDYDQWAACYVQSPMALVSWTSPSTYADSYHVAEGWKEISASTKAYFADNKPSDDLPIKKDYQFKVADKMAFVTFTENQNPHQTRVLEKIGGQWKILRMEASASNNFKKFHQRYKLQNMIGDWEIDMSTLKESDDDGWKLVNSKMSVQSIPGGVKIDSKDNYRTDEGEFRFSEATGLMTMDMPNNTIGAMNSVYFPMSNWSRVYMSQGRFDENGKLNMEGTEVGGEAKAKWAFWIKGDRLHYEVEVKNPKGEVVYSASHQSKRADMPKNVMP